MLHTDYLITRPRFRNVIAPVFQENSVWKNQVGHDRRLVQERREADNKQVIPIERALESQGVRQSVHRVGVMHHHQSRLAAANIIDNCRPVRRTAHPGGVGKHSHGTGRVESNSAAAARAAHQVVQGVDGHQVELAVGVGAGAVTAQSDAWAVVGEVVSQVANLLCGRLAFVQLFGDSQQAGNIFRREGRKGRGSLPVGQGIHVHALGLHSFADDHVGQAQGQVALHARTDGQPLVGVGRRHGKAGVNMHQVTPASLGLAPVALAEFAVGRGQAGGTLPGRKKVGAKGNYIVGVANIKVGQAVLVEHALDCGAVGGIVQRLKSQLASAQGCGEPVGDHAQGAAQGFGNQDHALAAGPQLPAENVQSLRLPLYGAVLTGTAGTGAQHGAGQAVGMVHGLETYLGPDALLALVHRVLGVALNLLGAALHHPDNYAVAVGGLAAQRGVPVVPSLYQVLRQGAGALEAQFLVLDNVTSYRSDSGEAGPGQEVAPCQFHTLMPSIRLACTRYGPRRLPVTAFYL